MYDNKTYMIHETDKGNYFTDCHGFMLESEETIRIAKGLLKYAKKHKDVITEYNIRQQLEFEKGLGGRR